MSQPAIELRDRDQAESWLAGGLCLMRLQPLDADIPLRVSPWLVGVLSDFGALPPPGALADIGHLLTGSPMRAMVPVPPVDPELTRVMHAYEDHVLGRLDADPRLDAIGDAIARMPEEKRDRAVPLFVAHLARRLGHRAAVALSPGTIRQMTNLTAEELVTLGHSALVPASEVTRSLIAGYEDLIAGARRLGSLITEAEVFLIENLDALSDLTQRIAIGQIIEIADALAAAMPRRLKPSSRSRRARIPTPLASEDHYPTGGFSALSTSGSIENLVISELIYMEEDDEATEGVDLFDLRYAEGELLYYTRDESVFVRGHREISFVLMPDLIRARFKDPQLRWQRLIMVLGLLNCCVRRLVEWLADEGLRFRILFVSEGRSPDDDPLHVEFGLSELSLREWVRKEIVEVAYVDQLDQALTQAEVRALSVRADVVVVSAERTPVTAPAGVQLGHLWVDDAEPVTAWAAEGATAPSRADESSDLWPAWVRATLELLQALL